MPVRRCADQINGKAVVSPFQHMERLSKAQVSENVHGQVAKPVAHTLWAGPLPALLLRRSSDPQSTTNGFTERSHVGQYVPLHLLDGTVTKRMRHHTPFARM